MPGNGYEFTQPVKMRMNQPIAGARADFAAKRFGDDLDQLIKSGGGINAVVGVCRRARCEDGTGHGLADAVDLAAPRDAGALWRQNRNDMNA